MKIAVYHQSYGCDTGCCGHVIKAWDETGDKGHHFTFEHPYGIEDFRAWAQDLVREEWGDEHVADLDWDECLISDD